MVRRGKEGRKEGRKEGGREGGMEGRTKRRKIDFLLLIDYGFLSKKRILTSSLTFDQLVNSGSTPFASLYALFIAWTLGCQSSPSIAGGKSGF